MECSECGRTNRADSRFCDACGHTLVLRCGACDRELNHDARFCDGCGTPTVAAAGPEAAPPAAREAAVRKTVTVLFCDLVGSTAFAEAVDTESAREAMGRYHAMAQATVEANGGTVAKFIGDGVMALFGVPEVAEDDAERAVLTGRALQRGFVPIREHVAKRYGVEVGLRVGINTGEVVIDDADADLVGDVLNTAARLEAQCHPGEVLVGEDTWRLTRGLLEYQALGEVKVKGKRDSLATFQLVTDDDGAPADPGAADLAELAIPFVGRDAEIGQLRAVLDDAIAAGEARLATVIGSPGVGKTRLARELGRGVGDDARFVELRCERAGTATFAPIAELLRTVAEFDDDATPDEIVEALRTLVGSSDEGPRLVELLGSFVGTAAPRSTEDAFFAVRRLVELLGERQPLVLVIDDIQWAEPLFLDLLEHLAQWAKAAPALVVGLARPEIRDIRPPLAEPGRRVAAVVSLEGLDAAATERLAAGLLGGAALPQELTARLPDSTNGNPLFVRELVRMLVDDGVIVQVGDRWDLAVDAEAIEVPPTIQSLLATRVERLPHAERRVLELASVVGPEFPLGALAALLPDTGGDDLDVVIERLRRKEQIEPTGTYWGDEPVIRFHHVLIRDAAYRRLLKGARADLHLEVAAWMESTSEHLTGDFDVVIAHHFEQAYLYRRQLNDDDASTTAAGGKAAALLHRAADAALQRDDLAAAGGYANRALATLEVDADEVPDLLLLACESFLSSGDVGNGRALVKQLGDHAVGDDRLEAWTTCFDAQLSVLTEPDQLREASDRAADAAAQLQHLGDQAGVAKAHIIRAQALARLGQVGAAEGELDLALTAARAAHDRRRITAVLSAAPVAALWGPSPVPRAGGRCLDVVRLSRITADSPEVEATSVRCQAVLEALRGRFDTARALLATARATTEKIGLRQGLLETRYFAGIVELLAGDPVAAEPHLRRAYGGLGQLGIGADAGQAAAYLARALLLQGRLDEADELATDSDALAGQNLQTAIAARSAQAEILAVRGETVEALALAEEAVRLAADTDIVLDHANALATLARVRNAHGNRAGAERAATSANDLFTQKGATVLVETTQRAAQPVRSASEPSTPPERAPAVTKAATDEPWSLAHRWALGRLAMMIAGDLEGIASRVHMRATITDHRPLMQNTVVGREAIVEQMRVTVDLLGGQADITATPVAVRGDLHLLGRVRNKHADAGNDSFVETLELVEHTSDGQVIRTSHRDPSDLAAALEELDEWYLESIDPSGQPAAFTLLASDHATTGRRSADMLRAFHRDLELIDRSAIGWGTLTGREAARERVESWADIPEGFVAYTPRVHRTDRQYALYETCFHVDGTHGDVTERRFIVISRLGPGSGQVTHWEQFELDELDAAVAHFENLVADDVALRVNGSIRTGTVASFLAHLGETDDLRRVFAEDFVADGAGLTEVTRANLLDGRSTLEATGFGVEYREVVSVIGERLAMLFVEVAGGERRWSVEEIDEHGRLARIRHFPADSFAEATNYLEERWQAIEHAPAAVRVRHAYGRAARSEKSELADLLAEDFSLVDHRSLGLGRLDRTATLSFNARDNQGELGELTPLELHAASERAVVISSAVVAVTDAGDLSESLVCTVLFAARDGKVERVELFDEGDIGAAMARAAEIDPDGFPAPAGSDAVTPTDEPWNDADRWTREAHEIWITRGIDATAGMIDEGFTSSDHRQGVCHDIAGRDEWADNLDVARGGFGRDWRIEYDTVATRGSLLVLHRITHTQTSQPGEAMAEVLQVGQWSNEGLQLSTALFDADDLVAALFELDQRYLQSPAPDPVVVLGLLTDHAFMDRTPHTVHVLMHRDVEIVDHRAIGWGSTVGREAVRDRFDSMTDLPEGFAYYASRWVRSSALTGLFEGVMRVTGEEGAESTSTYLGVTRSDPSSGLSTNWEQFEADDLDRATARFEELVTADADLLANRTVVAGGLVNAIVRMDDLNHLASFLAPDFAARCDAVSDATINRDEFVDGAVDPTEIGFGVEHRRVVSVIGERLAMLYVETNGGERRFSVEEIDGQGRLTRVEHFALSDLAAAANHLEQRWLDVENPPESVRAIVPYAVVHRAAELPQTDRAERIAACLADDFSLVDHRDLSFEPVAKDEHVAVLSRGRRELGTLVAVEPIAATDRVGVARSVMLAVTDDGDFWETNVNISLWTQGDGLVHRIELFADDDADGAMARAAELDPDGFRTADVPDGDPHEPWNEADRLHREILSATQAWDIGKWRRMMAIDVLTEDRRALLQHELRGRSAAEAFYGDDEWQRRRHRCDSTTVASRGDGLVLLDIRWTPADDPDGPALEHLQISRWDGGQMVHVITFDPDDLRAAMDELNRMFLATLDPITAGEYRHTFRFLDHLSDGELEPVMAVQRPDTLLVDHRPLGWGTDQRYDELRERFRTLTESENSITELVRRFHHASPHLVCLDYRIVNESPEGARLVDDHIIVSRMDRETGFGMRVDQFADEQLDDALTLVESRIGELEAEMPQANLATRAGTVANLAARVGNLDDLLAILADDFVAELADGRAVTVDDIRSGRIEPTEVGFGIADRRIEDAVVDRIALLSAALETGTRVWSIESVDGTGRIDRVTHITADQPTVANREHLVRAQEFVDDGPLPTILRFVVASQDRDRDAIRDVLTPDFSFTDHRELGFGQADRDAYVDLQATPPSDDPTLTAALRITRIEAQTDQLMVGRFKRIYLNPQGESWEAARGISVNLIRDGAQQVVELFDDDQLDAALARAAELDPEGFGGDGSAEADDVHEPWNRADRLNRLATEHFFAGRIDAWAAMIANNYQGEQRRKLLGHDFTTKRDLETANRAMLEHATTPVAQVETLAARDDDLVLTRLRVTLADDPDGPLIDVLDLTQWNDDDQCTRTVTFDADEVIAAIDELDRLCSPSLDPGRRALLGLVRLIDKAIRTRDLDRIVASPHPDIEWIDHRPLGWGVVSGLDEYRNRLSTLTDIRGELVRYMRWFRYPSSDPFTAVIGCRSQVTSPEGSVSVDDHILVSTGDPGSGLTTRIEQFDRDEFDRAIGRSRELARSRAHFFDRTRAVAIVAHANASLRVGSADDLLEHVADDFVAVGIGRERATITIAELRSGARSPADLGFGGHDREVVAVRGERLVLVRVGPLEPAGPARHWSLAEVDNDGRIVGLELFDDADLLGAIEALEDRARELSEPPVVPDAIWRWEQAHRRLDVDALAELTSDDYTLVDHRARGYEPMGRADALANLRDWAADEALRGVPVHTTVHAAGRSWCVLQGAIWLPRQGDYWTGSPFIAVVECDNHAVTRIELFGEDQLDEALAHAAELEPPAGDTVERQVISAIGERTRLAIVSFGTERHWAVELLDGDGDLESATTFPISDTDAALDEYHTQVGEHEEIGAAADVVLRYVSAVRRADREGLERLVAERGQLVDHRPLGYGRLDQSALIDMVMTPATGTDRGLMIATALLQAEGPTAVLPFTRLFVTDEGESWEAAGGFVTALVHDGHVIRFDLFADDGVDDALAQAARFEPALGGPDAPDLPDGWFYDGTIDPLWLAERGPLEADAAGVTLCFVDAVAVADVDVLDATLDPDFATDDHRPVGWGPRSREEFRDAVGQRPKTLGTGVAHGEFLLQLGPVGLCRYEVTTSAPETGGEISEVGLGVTVVAEGRVRWMELYGEADLAAAVVRTRELAHIHQPDAGPTNRADRLARLRPELLGGGSGAEIETLAVRLDDWALHRLTDRSGPGSVAYVTTQWGTDGELIAREEFNSLHDAETHLDLKSFGSLEPTSSPDPALIEWGRVTRLRDWESAAQLLAPEYRATSDQFLQRGGDVTGDELLEWFALDADQSHSRELVLDELHAASPVGGVANETDHYIDDAGASSHSGGAALITVRDGLLTSAIKRDDDRLPELLDELDRLTAEHGGTVAYLSETARALRGGRRSSAEP